MNEDFQKIYDNIPKLLNSFSEIENSASTARDAMRAITKTFQEEANLYCAILNLIKNGYLIRDSAFGNNKDHVQNYLRHLSARDISDSDFLVNIQKGKLLIGSRESEDELPRFNGAPFPFMASWIFFPIERKGAFFGVIELCSEKTIPPANYSEDSIDSHVFRLPLEALMSRINQIASKFEDAQ
jgi:hypothetical protein